MRKFKKLIVADALLIVALSTTIVNGADVINQPSRNNVQIQSEEDEEIVQISQAVMMTSQSPFDDEEEDRSEESRGLITGGVVALPEYLTVDEVVSKMNFDMNMGEPCGLSKDNFVELLENLPYDYTGLYERNAESIWEYEQKYQVNAIFVCGIIAQESGWGKFQAAQNNFAGLGGSGNYLSFETEEEGIEYIFECLKEGYISQGLTTVSAIAVVYTANSTTKWHYNVFAAMKMIVTG